MYSIDLKKHTFSTPHYTIAPEIANAGISIKEGIAIKLKIKDQHEHFNCLVVRIPIPKKDVKELKTIREAIDHVNKELGKCVTKLTELPRKERQVRSKIVEKKIEKTSLKGLLNSPELTKLIEG